MKKIKLFLIGIVFATAIAGCSFTGDYQDEPGPLNTVEDPEPPKGDPPCQGQGCP